MAANKLKDALTDQFFAALLLLETESECYKFFEDVCTVNELKSLAQRLEVARMLKIGNTYDDIVESTGVSTATIARVKRCFYYGAGGYKLALSRLGKTKNAKSKDGEKKKNDKK
jgi:TrpR-related protein YerC/YecD